MKSTKFFLFGGIFVVLCSSFAYGKKKERVKVEKNTKDHIYMVGVAASFTDSLIYFTDIEQLQGIHIGKSRMLPDRELYSQQLKTHLEQEEGLTNRTCFVYFSKKKKRMDKLITKMKHRYQKTAALYIRQVNPNTFHFRKLAEEGASTTR
ncbi:hypothetical protein [Phocaeicola abscessus]|uniref:hypothetical protein n=1 Tax=Phocaeicola abscessus TaxID=555313 RepID=UPI0003860B57|nr:hypothetical protein [Phocaeicola abscessus]EPT34285.1 hypothetical protein HMPREF9012_1805 [Bacteroidetes bacterium oral taxon 272 str. F0290]